MDQPPPDSSSRPRSSQISRPLDLSPSVQPVPSVYTPGSRLPTGVSSPTLLPTRRTSDRSVAPTRKTSEGNVVPTRKPSDGNLARKPSDFTLEPSRRISEKSLSPGSRKTSEALNAMAQMAAERRQSKSSGGQSVRSANAPTNPVPITLSLNSIMGSAPMYNSEGEILSRQEAAEVVREAQNQADDLVPTFQNVQLESQRRKVYDVMFSESDAGTCFEVTLLLLITISVILVVIESSYDIRMKVGTQLRDVEWFFTATFTVEYIFRLLVYPKSLGGARAYAKSFFGVVDLLSCLPTYIALFVNPDKTRSVGLRSMRLVRVFRLLRCFKIFKCTNYQAEGALMLKAITGSMNKILVFAFTMFTLELFFGSVMYLVEGEDNGFTSLPLAIYWCIATVATVGYGDIYPQTGFGKFVACFVMLTGYCVLAVPTGLIAVSFAEANEAARLAAQAREEEAALGTLHRTYPCDSCGHSSHEAIAVFCKRCGTKLPYEEDVSLPEEILDKDLVEKFEKEKRGELEPDVEPAEVAEPVAEEIEFAEKSGGGLLNRYHPKSDD